MRSVIQRCERRLNCDDADDGHRDLDHHHDPDDNHDNMLLVNAVVPSALLIAIPHNPQAADTCLSKYYYGTHGQQDIFITNDELCVAEMPSHLVEDGSLGSISGDVQQLVWLQHEAVDPAIKPATFVDEIDSFLSHLPTAAPTPSDNDQVVFGKKRAAAQLLHRTENAALISVDSETALTLDQHLPAFWKASPLPDSPIDFIPVPSKAIERVKDILNNLKFDPVVASLVNNISVPQLRADVRYLTGESSSSEIVSRHSFSSGVLIAAEWLKTNFENLGATCELKPYLSGFAPNVIW